MKKELCPVCGKPAIGRSRAFNEFNCGYHYWKYSEGKIVILPPIGDENRPD
jgi:hypothetical protein